MRIQVRCKLCPAKTLDTASYSPFALSRASDEFGVCANTGGEPWQAISIQSACVQESVQSVGSLRQSSVSAPLLEGAGPQQLQASRLLSASASW
jgi:hypothetical protein